MPRAGLVPNAGPATRSRRYSRRSAPRALVTEPRLISGKLGVPPVPGPVVDRPRLTADLDRGARRRLTMVAGPAGAGKTALLASWPAAGTAAWVTLDEDDNDPTRLWAYLLAAVRQSAGVPAGHPLAALDAPSTVDSAFLDGVLAAADALPAPVVLVLDNAGCLYAGAAADSLAALVRHPVAGLRLVLSGREAPPLPLGRLRMAGELAEIGADDLAFTPDEAARLCRLRRPAIGADELGALVARTEGWAAGLHLALAAGPEPDIEPETAYLRGEVFAAQPPDVRDFLLRTSVVDTLTGDLANELSGRRDGPRLLERLRDGGLFVRPAGSGLRYQRPFRDFLRYEAGIELAVELPELHRRAARWYARHGDPVTAARHAADAGDWPHAARLVVRHAAPGLFGPDSAELRRLLGRLPAAGAGPDPEVTAARALASAVLGDEDATVPRTAEAHEQLDRVPAEHRPAVRAALALVSLLAAVPDGDPSTLDSAAAELRGALDGERALRALALAGAGEARLWAGDLEAAEATLGEAAEAAEHHGLPLAAAGAFGGRALAQVLRGQVTAAAESAGAAVRLAGSEGSPYAALGYLVLGLVHGLRGEPDDAYRCLGAARVRLGEGRPWPVLALAVAVAHARLLGSAGDIAGGRAVLAAAGRSSRGWRPPPLLADWLSIVDAELHLAEGHPVTALTTLGELAHGPVGHPLAGLAAVATARAHLATGLPARAASVLDAVRRRGGDLGLGARVEVWLVDALAAERLDRPGAVSIALGEALAAAVPVDLVEPFVTANGEVAALLARHRDLLAGHPRFAARVGAAPAAPAGAVVEPITEREGVVLRYLPTLLTMNEIAAELCVSPNTVKSHLRSVYRKLGVGTRRDAVHRARALGVL